MGNWDGRPRTLIRPGVGFCAPTYSHLWLGHGDKSNVILPVAAFCFVLRNRFFHSHDLGSLPPRVCSVFSTTQSLLCVWPHSLAARAVARVRVCGLLGISRLLFPCAS